MDTTHVDPAYLRISAWGSIFPSDPKYSLETLDVESFKGLDVFPIYCPGLTTIEKDENTYCMVHCNFGFCLQVTIRKNVIT